MERIIIIHWNKSTGPEPIIQYPPQKDFPSMDNFVKIWAKHEVNPDNSIVEFTTEKEDNLYISILQKFEGELYFLVLVYDKKAIIENVVTEYPDLLGNISKNLIELINTNKIPRAISEAFTTIKNYTKLGVEENLLSFFQDKIKNTILKILQKGVIPKAELTNILRQDYGFSTINIDLLLMSFIRAQLITKKHIPGSKECYFLVKDITCTKIPPNVNLLEFEEDKDIILAVKRETVNLYSNYEFIPQIEQKISLNFLADSVFFSLLKILREKSISVNECENILNNNNELFNELIEKKIIFEIKGYVFLLTDIRFIRFTPYYIIERLKERHEAQELSFDAYINHLMLLTDQMSRETSLLDYEVV